MTRVLIAGCGYVGSALGEALVLEGHTVWGLRRYPRSLPLGIRPIAADLASAEALTELPEGIEVVVYLASPGGGNDAHYRVAYVDGLATLLDALDKGGQRPERLIFASSTAVYAQDGGDWVDETSPTEPNRFAGQRLLEGEGVALGSGHPTCVVRFGGIYGPRRTRLVERVRGGNAVYRSRPSQYTNRIHREDCAGVIRHLMTHPSPESVYLGVDCDPAEERAVYLWLAGALGAPTPRSATRDDPPSERGNKRCRNDRLLASGYGFRYPTFREGYRAVIEDLV